uniref:UBA domain-containing protein n=1 Tax=Anopheles gambiae TaxID=7165 RepID=A0A0E4C7B2_ANOGA
MPFFPHTATTSGAGSSGSSSTAAATTTTTTTTAADPTPATTTTPPSTGPEPMQQDEEEPPLTLLPTDRFTEMDVVELESMGFKRQMVIDELRAANGDKTQATSGLFAKLG